VRTLGARDASALADLTAELAFLEDALATLAQLVPSETVFYNEIDRARELKLVSAWWDAGVGGSDPPRTTTLRTLNATRTSSSGTSIRPAATGRGRTIGLPPARFRTSSRCGSSDGPRSGTSSTTLEEQVEEDPRQIVLCSNSGVIEFASSSARRLLADYLQCTRGRVPASVLRATQDRPKDVERDGQRLIVRAARTGGLVVLLLARRTCGWTG
jgi:hypothetical protein